ncbi:hypothetical protein NDU88_004333 [Pleurodeles waltl]|uniref:Uncharacterized protein n=1 Tax=Pleurodeles waltl TaxID=8319 RepID=A0AAV7V0Y1_PLEWA|nr:hypothetical protein NDU88_004333 [Pleurodeles waltl]
MYRGRLGRKGKEDRRGRVGEDCSRRTPEQQGLSPRSSGSRNLTWTSTVEVSSTERIITREDQRVARARKSGLLIDKDKGEGTVITEHEAREKAEYGTGSRRQHGKPRGQSGAPHRGNHQGGKGSGNNAHKDWILKQIRGSGTDEGKTQEERDRASGTAQDSEEPPNESKKRQRNTSRGAKKGDKRDAGDLPEAGTPGTSKKAKANNGEQISMIVQECLKSMAPLLFAKTGGACDTKGPGDTESREDPAPSNSRGKGSQATRAEAAHKQGRSPYSGEEEAAPTSTAALPTQV